MLRYTYRYCGMNCVTLQSCWGIEGIQGNKNPQEMKEGFRVLSQQRQEGAS